MNKNATVAHRNTREKLILTLFPMRTKKRPIVRTQAADPKAIVITDLLTIADNFVLSFKLLLSIRMPTEPKMDIDIEEYNFCNIAYSPRSVGAK